MSVCDGCIESCQHVMMAALKPNMLGIIIEKRQKGNFKTEHVVSLL
jgi:hypothetical protein